MALLSYNSLPINVDLPSSTDPAVVSVNICFLLLIINWVVPIINDQKIPFSSLSIQGFHLPAE